VSPFTFVAHTYNLWGSSRWAERRPFLERFFRLHGPDVLCVQELTPEASELIAETVPALSRVDDPLDGSTREDNIFWDAGLFEAVEHGTVDINILVPSRHLFWVRLRIEGTASTMLVATAHFDWVGNTREVTERFNVRVDQAERTVEALDGLADAEEPVLFMGDLNDDWHPLAVLRDAGFADSFAALGRAPVPTHPALPLNGTPPPPRTYDWMLHRGPIRPLLTSVIYAYAGVLPGSDHRPVATTYRIEAPDRLGDPE